MQVVEVHNTDTMSILDMQFPRIVLSDSHCHLNLIYEQDNKIIEYIRKDALDIAILDVGISPSDWTKRQNLFKAMGQVYFSAGLHPCHTKDYSTNQLIDELEPIVPHANAVGETGLDWYRMYAPKHIQYACFEVQISLAKKYCKPLIIHSRESIDDILDMIEQAKITSSAGAIGVMHCFSGTKAQAIRSLDLGLYISFAANCSYNSAVEIREVAAMVPSDRLLTETDAPFLLHNTVRKIISKQKNPKQNIKYHRTNTPLYLPFLCQTLAKCRKSSVYDIAMLTRANFNTFLKQLPAISHVV